MAKNPNPNKAKRRVVRSRPSNSGTNTQLRKSPAAAATSAKKKGGALGWIFTPAVPPAKGLGKIAPKHVFKILTSKRP